MNGSIRGRTVYEPIPMSSRRSFHAAAIPAKVFQTRVPPILASLIFLTLLGFGFLDSLVLRMNPVETVVFPGENLSVIPVQRASLEIRPRRPEVQKAVFTEHHVAHGETLSFVSYKYGLSPATLISVNRLQRPEDLKVGSVLIIPYRDGVRQRAHGGESSSDAALRLGIDPDSIQILPDGDFFVSGKSYTGEIPAAFADDMFRYPVSGRVITPFGSGVDDLTDIPYRSDGIDLAAELGTPVVASRKGEVILTGHHSSYGLYVILDHSKGWKSFYGNLGRIAVAPGDSLDGGTVLGTAGKSGTARSPRLHFVLIKNGETVDPLDYLY